MPTRRFEPDDFESLLALLPRQVDGLPMRHAPDPGKRRELHGGAPLRHGSLSTIGSSASPCASTRPMAAACA